MKHARAFGRRRWVVAPHPFVDADGMYGCELEHELGAYVVPNRIDTFMAQLLGKEPVRLSPSAMAKDGRFTEPSRPLDPEEERVLGVLTVEPRHTDEIAEEVGLSAPNVTTALLTLALEDVVVEGPGGFFRRH
jgi:DNA processing protein